MGSWPLLRTHRPLGCRWGPARWCWLPARVEAPPLDGLAFRLDRPQGEVGPTHPPGSQGHRLAGREGPWRHQPFAHACTAAQRLGGVCERQPIFACGDMRPPILIADPGDAMGPPPFPRARAIAQALARGGSRGSATDLGPCTNALDDIRRRRPTRRARLGAGHSPLGMSPPVPVPLQEIFWRLRHTRTDHRMQHGTQAAFFPGDRGGFMLPHQPQIVAETPSALARLVCERDVRILPCREVDFDLAHPWQRRMPAPRQRPGHSSRVGSDPVGLSPGVGSVLLGCFQGQLSSVAWRVLFRPQPIPGISGGVDGRRRQRLQDRGGTRRVHAEAPEAQTGCRAPLAPTALAKITRESTGVAALAPSERAAPVPPTPPTAA